jgi:hypothetical protein
VAGDLYAQKVVRKGLQEQGNGPMNPLCTRLFSVFSITQAGHGNMERMDNSRRTEWNADAKPVEPSPRNVLLCRNDVATRPVSTKGGTMIDLQRAGLRAWATGNRDTARKTTTTALVTLNARKGKYQWSKRGEDRPCLIPVNAHALA